MTTASTIPRVGADDAVEMLKALADPVRLDLLRRIAAVNEMACTTLTNESSVAASTVSYHVKILKAAGFVRVRKDGRNFHYTLRPETIDSLRDYLGDIATI